MTRVTFDTNVVASGLLGLERETSTPGELLRRWLASKFELVTSDHLIAEIEETPAEPYVVAHVSRDIHEKMMSALTDRARRIAITILVSGVATHPEDDLVLATAVSAEADYLVTGDRQLVALGSYQGVIILSPRAFLTLLDAAEDDEP